MTAITKRNHFLFEWKEKIKHDIGLTALLLFLSPFKNILTFLCWFVFLVFNTLQQKTRRTFLLKSYIINNIQWQRCRCWVTVMSQCLLCPFDILLAHAVHRWISFIGNENSAYVFMSSGQLWWDFMDIKKIIFLRA